ncbi:hypothetical protein IFM89_027589 [Coptis chinensis]|uniref:Phospholipase D n=1 Tax=Coptis chinensis TaxID=261450 RepID=A0A835IPV9_9MAGN|nr:hypothetical protein IFM89_027589 [Coptis chinensis]
MASNGGVQNMEVSIAEDETSEEIIFLHGDLQLTIREARSLPNMDMLTEHIRRCFVICEPCKQPFKTEEQKIKTRRKIITSDPYVTVLLTGATVARTRILSNSQNPKWNENFKIPLAHPVSNVEFQVKDNDVFGAQLIGIVLISANRIRTGESISDWFPVIGSYGKPPKPDSALFLEMKFTPVENNPLYKHGIPGDPLHLGVRNTYFPLRRGESVTLYQDAHVKLIREPTKPLPRGGEGGNLTLGELLKYKSAEGVRVLLLVWDDKTSHNKFFLKTAGVMGTHDEDTRKFFKHSSVNCVLAPRYASSKLSIFKQQAVNSFPSLAILHQVVGTLFTHHQKCVLVDSQASGNYRKITAFVGGLDLCDGRYDTPEHRLFRDLDTVFTDDYHNPTFSGTKGPRQPWHDLHSRIDGPAAYDVLENFEHRWRKATKWSEFGKRFKKIRHWHDDSLIKLERISWILSPSPSVPSDAPLLWVSREDDPETWHVQIFRSIDSGSVQGLPKEVHAAVAQNLICDKNVVIDRSIHTAYIQAIRSAQHFIYIENQYFLGSSYGWPSYKNAGADNLIPMELALKIASKIRAGERFAVYIIIPMWPEGVPSSAAVQEILFWQSQTMQMMYGIIAKELKDMQLEGSHPQDYLNFYCLGNREELPMEISSSNSQLPANGDASLASQKSRRFMIYVHAKGMIVDDEYVIVGSANINQRSLDGSRDTEIAMGAYQPHYAWEVKKKHPHGQVYGYRMSLWAEHLGMLDDCFHEPQSLDCVKSVNERAQENWKRFTAEEITTLHGHLLKYPLQIDADGKVEPLPDHENFPDVGGKIIGTYTSLPDALTT